MYWQTGIAYRGILADFHLVAMLDIALIPCGGTLGKGCSWSKITVAIRDLRKAVSCISGKIGHSAPRSGLPKTEGRSIRRKRSGVSSI